MSQSSSLASATARLEENDDALNGIDLRGKGKGHRDRPVGRSSRERPDAPAVPRPEIRRFTTALANFHRSSGRGGPRLSHPSTSSPWPATSRSSHCRLNYLALHNHFLDPCELPLLFDALPFLPSLETFVLFHHDVGDDGAKSLMRALMGAFVGGGETKVRDGETRCRDARTTRLRELYLSHCGIGCAGASEIAEALDHSSSADASSRAGNGGDELKWLQVLGLGSNRIRKDGALSLARAFGRHPSLQRMVLHGNEGIPSSLTSTSEKEPNASLSSSCPPPSPTARAAAIFAPLVLPHVRRRWEAERVLARPHDLLRRRLREEMYRRDSPFVDANLEAMPDVLAWMGREGACIRRTGLHSRSTFDVGGRDASHSSSGDERCLACASIHLNDVYMLFRRMPHLVGLFRSISTSCSEPNLAVFQTERGKYL